jgi:hypothetical protein
MKISTLFGKKPVEKKEPFDVVEEGAIQLHLFRNERKDGYANIGFSFKRPYEYRGESMLAMTFDTRNLWDLLGGLSKLALRLASREDLHLRDRETAMQFRRAVEQLVASRSGHSKDVNGHGESNR